MAGIKYDIEKEIGVISQSSKGWNKENNREAKYDIRDWDEDHQKMGKGITFTKEELINLKELLNSIDI